MRLILDSFRFVSSALILCIPMNRSAVNKHFSILGFNYSPRLFTKPGNQTNRTCYYLVSKITDIVYLSYFQACTSENRQVFVCTTIKSGLQVSKSPPVAQTEFLIPVTIILVTEHKYMISPYSSCVSNSWVLQRL